jgi:Fe-S cluster assembly protein SufB
LRKEEPEWMTDWRIEAWEQMVEPEWANVNYAKPDFQAILLLSTKAVDPNKTLDDVDPELLEMYIRIVQFPFAAAMATQMRY